MEHTQSRMQIKAVINAVHDGEILDVGKEEIIFTLKESIAALLKEEDDGISVNVSVYVSRFSYTDNLDNLRAMATSLLSTMDSEELQETIRLLRKKEND